MPVIRKYEYEVDVSINLAKGALRFNEQREIVVYIFALDEKTMELMHKSEKAGEVRLVRQNQSGQKLPNSYNCIYYGGRYYGPMPYPNKAKPYHTTLNVTNMEIHVDYDLGVFIKWIELEGEHHRCLVIANQVDKDMKNKRTNEVIPVGENMSLGRPTESTEAEIVGDVISL